MSYKSNKSSKIDVEALERLAKNKKREAPSKRSIELDISKAEAWGACFQNNKTLLHLDISHNGFDSEEVKILAEGLLENQTILGVHMEGNEGKTDALGFVSHLDQQN